MARPRKFYIIFEYGEATDIAYGLTEARRRHSGSHGFTTRAAAEEFSAWWNYEAFQPGGHLAHRITLSDTHISSPPKEQTSSPRHRRLWAYPSGGYRWVELYTSAHP
ncbi:MAG TPA: hypothetical protein VL147_10620 [Devosia sp.]|nr:hypothetical protein [Devosia sp.]